MKVHSTSHILRIPTKPHILELLWRLGDQALFMNTHCYIIHSHYLRSITDGMHIFMTYV
jgi:hypothetical protein